MQNWQIAAIVAICVAFVLILLFYWWLYRHFTKHYDGRCCNENHLFYRDFHGKVTYLDMQRVDQSLCDPRNALRLIAQDIAVTHQGYGSGISRTQGKTSFEFSDADLLTLARFDEESRSFIELDLEIFFSDEFREELIYQTAAIPLVVVHRQLPVPKISPPQTLISTDSRITIKAEQFCFRDSQEEHVPDHLLPVLERAMSRGQKRVLHLGDGETLVVNPEKRSALIRASSGSSEGQRPPREIIQLVPGQLRYQIEKKTEGWVPYQGPFKLPVGRWCVKAEVAAPGRASVRTTSKVYSVEEGFSSI